MGCCRIKVMQEQEQVYYLYLLYIKRKKRFEIKQINIDEKDDDTYTEIVYKDVYLIKKKSIRNLINIIERTNILNNSEKTENIEKFNQMLDSYNYLSDKNIEFICDYSKANDLVNNDNNENNFIIVEYTVLIFLGFNRLDNEIVNKKVKLSINKKNYRMKIQFLASLKELDIDNIVSIYFRFI